MRSAIALVGGLCAGLVLGAGAAQAAGVTFEPGPTAPTADFVSHLAVGDFNRDRDPDLAVSTFGGLTPDKLGILLGGPGATFKPELPLTRPSDFPYEIAPGDFNRDGKIDLAVATFDSFNATTGVAIYAGDGKGGFEAPVHFSTGAIARAVAVGDVNRDGDLDLVVANNFDDVVLLLGGPGASFGPPQPVLTSSFNTDVVLADFNRDRDLDVAVSNGRSNTVEVAFGGAGNTFVPHASYGVGESPWEIAVANLDGDADPDLVISNQAAAGPAVFVLRGGPDGAFTAAPQVDPGRDARSLAVGDLNRDGDPDLSYLSFKSGVDDSGVVRVALGGLEATFGSPVSVSAWPGFVPDVVAMADLDGDSDLDLTVGLSSSIRTLINTTPRLTYAEAVKRCIFERDAHGRAAFKAKYGRHAMRTCIRLYLR